MKPIRLLSGVVTVGGWTMASRVLGFIRDAMIVAMLGTGTAYSAYIVAFTLPNMFRRFFAEGAFNMAFVPLFAKRLETGDQPAEFAQEAFSALAWVLIALTGVAMVAMPLLVFAMASGFYGREEFGLAVEYGRICFPYILFISLTALSSGVLNATGHFGPAAAAPVVLNVIFILFLAVAALTGGDVPMALVWSVPVYGRAEGSAWVGGCRRCCWRRRCRGGGRRLRCGGRGGRVVGCGWRRGSATAGAGPCWGRRGR